MKKNMIYLFVLGVLLLTMACGFNIGTSSDATEEPEVEDTVEKEKPTKEEVIEETPAIDFQATQDVMTTEAAAIAATQVAGQFELTQQASTIYADIQQLYDDRIISTTDGQYYTLPGFDESWAQLGWYQWYETGHSPSNFVVKTDMTYKTASNITDWPAAGCGFVFRLLDSDNSYSIFYTLDGYVYMWAYQDGKYVEKGRGYYGKPDIPAGKAQIMLVAEDDWVTFFVEGKQVFRKQDSAFSSGGLYYSVESGTNKDFGQQCTFENVELWELP